MKEKIKIWIVEDEAIIAQNLQWTLEDLGYQVMGQSYDYNSALEAIRNESFDLLILDINLNSADTSRNGLALARQLQATKDVPFIFLSAYDDKDTITTAAQLRPSAYLIKPVNAATLFAAVQTAIENHRESKPATMPHEQYEAPDYFFSKIGAKLHKIYWKDVLKMESTKNYVSIKTANNNSEFLLRGSLVQIMQYMVPEPFKPDFFKINRATVLHRNAIISLHLDSVYSTFGMIGSTEETVCELKKVLLLPGGGG